MCVLLVWGCVHAAALWPPCVYRLKTWCVFVQYAGAVGLFSLDVGVSAVFPKCVSDGHVCFGLTGVMSFDVCWWVIIDTGSACAALVLRTAMLFGMRDDEPSVTG
jgi:hypothetical protein